MENRVEFGCLPTAIGSMPHADPREACATVTRYLPEIPAWPQLPMRSPREDMAVQFSEGFPDLVIDGNRLQLSPSEGFEGRVEQVYLDADGGDCTRYGMSAEFAAGFDALLSGSTGSRFVKGQLTGPVTWGLSVLDQQGHGILYDDMLAELTSKFLGLKAAWQERALSKLSANTIVFVDEPYLLSLGSVFAAIPDEKVPALLGEVMRAVRGLKGIHCCGNTDWSVLLGTPIDVLSFDAYSYGSSLSTYSDEVKAFLGRGAAIAWGIVPNDEAALPKESVSSLRDRLEEAVAPFTRDGLPFRQILSQSLITPSCGLATLTPEAACQALELTAELSRDVRKRYLS